MCAEAGHAHVPPEGHVEEVSSSARWGCCGKMRPLDKGCCGKMRPLDGDGSDGGCGGCGGSRGEGGLGVGNAGGAACKCSSRRSGGGGGNAGGAACKCSSRRSGGGGGNAGGDPCKCSSRRSAVSRISWSEVGHGSNGRAQNGASTGGIARSSNACTLVLLNAYLMSEVIRQPISRNQWQSGRRGVPDEGRNQRRHQRGSRTRKWMAHQATTLMREAIRRHQRGSRTRNWMAHQATGRTAAHARTNRSTRRVPRGTSRSRHVERARCGRAARSRALRMSSLPRRRVPRRRASGVLRKYSS